MSTDIATQEAGVPELHNSPQIHETITAQDVSLPRIKVAQKMTKREDVSYADIYTDMSNDDPNAVVLASAPKIAVGEITGPVRVFLLAIKKTVSWGKGADFTVRDYGDPEAPANARVGYQYFVALPRESEVVPYKLTLSGLSAQAAKGANLQLRAAAASGYQTDEIPFELSAKQAQNSEGAFCILRLVRSQEPATREELAAVELQRDLARTASAPNPYTRSVVDAEVTDAPAI